MAETHVWMVLVPFALNMWWTKSWLMDPIVARWRFAVAGLSSTILWIYLAYASTRAVEASGGVEIVYGSTALAYFSGFMALVSFIGILLGLMLWVEEEGKEASENLPQSAKTRF